MKIKGTRGWDEDDWRIEMGYRRRLLKEKGIRQYPVTTSHKTLLKHKLHDFWCKFKKLRKNTIKRLDLLKQYSDITIQYTKESKRNKYRVGLSKKFFKIKSCQCCGRDSKHRHHIIPLYKGGTNTDKNIIVLCEYCHSQIHPWMKQPNIQDTLTEEFKQVVNAL